MAHTKGETEQCGQRFGVAVPFGVVLLGMVLLTVGVLYLGVRQLRTALAEPFQVKELAGGQAGLSGQVDQNAELRAKDTDKDGLSDYDETYLHRTSPYLPDSDADGVADKAEVEAKTDPNCPEGKNCYGGLATTPSGPPSERGGGSGSNLGAVGNEAGAPSAAQLRDALKRAGVSDDVLAKVSDEELMKEYGAFIAEQPVNPPSQPLLGEEGAGTPPASANLFNLSGQQIRELLKSSGGEAVPGLEQLSDQQLQQIFEEALQGAGNQ